MSKIAQLAQTHRIAERVLALMRDANVAATPENFTVWFAYATAQNPEIVRSIDILRSNGRNVTDAVHPHSFTKAGCLPKVSTN